MSPFSFPVGSPPGLLVRAHLPSKNKSDDSAAWLEPVEDAGVGGVEVAAKIANQPKSISQSHGRIA